MDTTIEGSAEYVNSRISFVKNRKCIPITDVGTNEPANPRFCIYRADFFFSLSARQFLADLPAITPSLCSDSTRSAVPGMTD